MAIHIFQKIQVQSLLQTFEVQNFDEIGYLNEKL